MHCREEMFNYITEEAHEFIQKETFIIKYMYTSSELFHCVLHTLNRVKPESYSTQFYLLPAKQPQWISSGLSALLMNEGQALLFHFPAQIYH